MDRILDWGERLFIILLYGAFVVGAWHSTVLVNRIILVPEAMTIAFVIFRRTSTNVSTHPIDWLVAVLGTAAPLLARPAAAPATDHWLPIALMLAGTALSASAKFSLNRRFGITAANRGVQQNWAYRLVRHPMYAGYIVAHIGFLILNPSVLNAAVYLACWSLLIARISREELWLSKDPDYRRYVQGVRYRLVPGLY